MSREDAETRPAGVGRPAPETREASGAVRMDNGEEYTYRITVSDAGGDGTGEA